MDQGGGNKKDCHIPETQSRKLSSPSLGFFPSQVGGGKESRRFCGSVFCPLGQVSKMCSVDLGVRGGRVRTVQVCVVNY